MSRSEATTSVPKLQLTDRGFVIPSEPDVLAGVQADINAALGGAANMALDTPQGQIAMTMSAIIADCHDQLVALLNGIDPALATGTNAALLGALLDLDGVVDAWVTDNPTDEPMRFGALTLPPHNLFICVAGGETAAIGQVILEKKPPCCATFGHETVTVLDGNPAYKTRQPQYQFRFSRPDDVAVHIDVTLLQNDRIPADALDQIRHAVLQAAQSADGRARLRMGSEILASQFNASLAALGDWVQILGVRLGLRDGETVIPTERTFLMMEVYQLPYIQEDFITLTLKDSHDA